MSRGGITIFWRESKNNWNFPLDLLFLLDYTHYHGDWRLYLTEDNDWPPRGFKIPPQGGFTLGEIQAMSRRGIQKVAEFSTRLFMSG